MCSTLTGKYIKSFGGKTVTIEKSQPIWLFCEKDCTPMYNKSRIRFGNKEWLWFYENTMFWFSKY